MALPPWLEGQPLWAEMISLLERLYQVLFPIFLNTKPTVQTPVTFATPRPEASPALPGAIPHRPGHPHLPTAHLCRGRPPDEARSPASMITLNLTLNLSPGANSNIIL